MKKTAQAIAIAAATSSMVFGTTTPIGSIWSANSAAHGLDVRDATFDKRVMEFALAIPDREYIGQIGRAHV